MWGAKSKVRNLRVVTQGNGVRAAPIIIDVRVDDDLVIFDESQISTLSPTNPSSQSVPKFIRYTKVDNRVEVLRSLSSEGISGLNARIKGIIDNDGVTRS
jgi:hypothetical protein